MKFSPVVVRFAFRSSLVLAAMAVPITPRLIADVAVPAKTVPSGQNFEVVNPGQISTNNNAVKVELGGTAKFMGGTVVLKPGFRAYSGSTFTATIDSDGDGISDTADTDGDGLPDKWEMDHFGNLNATGTGDADGDGISNRDEFLAGRNPEIDETTTTSPGTGVLAVRVPGGLYYGVSTSNWSITPVNP